MFAHFKTSLLIFLYCLMEQAWLATTFFEDEMPLCCGISSNTMGCPLQKNVLADRRRAIQAHQQSAETYNTYQCTLLPPDESGFGGLVASMLAPGTQDRGFEPGWSRRIFQGEKIHSMPSFGGEVKPSVPCCRFAACKRILRFTWKSEPQAKLTGHFSP
jgi:hypothetical protein